ncbi:MAG: transketolase family protein [Candidatus Omnitrophica bacterium]|nr:transketolase family protein [Candidatus Omnitrophota bacterium]MCG2702823.1 transketolase family protein [Candidatus Omnitrophota bacterium]
MANEMMYQRDVYGKTLVELGKEDNDIVVLDADLSGSTRTSFFAEEFPERFFNFGVAEQSMMASAAGIASCGKTVFASTFAMFATGRAWDQVRNSICYSRLNVKIVATHAGVTVGPDGATHQALEDIALMRVIPNMTVIVPCDGPQTRDAVIAAAKIKGPVYIRLGRSKVPTIEGKGHFLLGRPEVLRQGKDVLIIACGLMTHFACEAHQVLLSEGIGAAVVNIHTIKPLDNSFIEKLDKETKGIVVCEEHSVIGGLGCAVEEITAGYGLGIPVMRVGVKNCFGQSGEPNDLLKEYNLQAADIIKMAKQVLK